MEEDSPNRPKRTKVLDIIVKATALVANLLMMFDLRQAGLWPKRPAW